MMRWHPRWRRLPASTARDPASLAAFGPLGCLAELSSLHRISLTMIRIDLRSDTKTRPTPGMRQAMTAAEVGDEQADEDPSVNLLCERVAALFGKEAALFLPSGTMCNQIAILVHCRPGDEIIAAEASHIISSESAGAAAL